MGVYCTRLKRSAPCCSWLGYLMIQFFFSTVYNTYVGFFKENKHVRKKQANFRSVLSNESGNSSMVQKIYSIVY